MSFCYKMSGLQDLEMLLRPEPSIAHLYNVWSILMSCLLPRPTQLYSTNEAKDIAIIFIYVGADDLIGDCRVGITTKEKLRKVIEWVQRAGSTLHNVKFHSYQQKRQLSINWIVYEEGKPQDCSSLLEVMRLTDSCKATFYASVGEIFLLLTWKHLHEFEEERMFISRRLSIMGDNNLVEDLICTGCQLCGSPLDSEFGSTFERTTIPLYCQKSSNRLHIVSLIYRPFMLYVWDDSKYIPLLVTNKAAELLFGNIGAERVYSCYQVQKHGQNPDPKNVHNKNCSDVRATKPNPAEGGVAISYSLGAYDLQPEEKHQCDKSPNFYLIWIILLKMLLQQGNSPLKFKVTVNADKDWETGKCEMVSVSMPCFRTKASSV
uniref:Uncharacterized protein n=1 Tax=Davidia involucrata TaxID=16924 RepID=A0A5B6YH09_DAVIN